MGNRYVRDYLEKRAYQLGITDMAEFVGQAIKKELGHFEKKRKK
jgi:hypothetical protein